MVASAVLVLLTMRVTAASRGAGARTVPTQPLPHNAQTLIVERYLDALRDARYADAYGLLDDAERGYYRDARNFASIFTADAYRIVRYHVIGARGSDAAGRVYFAREEASFRDHAHDVDLRITATVPVGVVPQNGGWRIKDPGHPWRAYATDASASAGGVRATVKKLSFFPRRIEAVVTFENTGAGFVTVLAYGKSILHDDAGHPYRIIETRDWTLTDKVLFEGLHLAPQARYTGMLAFTCEPLDNTPRTFTLTVAPLLADGGDAPFTIDVNAIRGAAIGAAPRLQ